MIVNVYWRKTGEEQLNFLGSHQYEGTVRSIARREALEALWDSILDTASCIPVCNFADEDEDEEVLGVSPSQANATPSSDRVVPSEFDDVA